MSEDKDWIQEKCNTNKPPTKAPDKPSIGNKSKNKLKKALEVAKKALETYAFLYDESIAKDTLKEIEELTNE